jgi:hypothetical protein
MATVAMRSFQTKSVCCQSLVIDIEPVGSLRIVGQEKEHSHCREN